MTLMARNGTKGGKTYVEVGEVLSIGIENVVVVVGEGLGNVLGVRHICRGERGVGSAYGDGCMYVFVILNTRPKQSGKIRKAFLPFFLRAKNQTVS